jgi:DNA adenine methylase
MKELLPFMKCPGGKRKLTGCILKTFPDDFDESWTYVEPFLGGGALTLELLSKEPKLAKKIKINDGNAHVFNLWKAVQTDVEALISKFEQITSEHSEEHFYAVRESLESLNTSTFTNCTDEAAKFLYLNKNCFNGSVRFNKKGQFNAPLGRYSRVQTVDYNNLRLVAKAIQKTSLTGFDFQRLVEEVESKSAARNWEKTLFYFDPPYIPLSATSHFTYYTADGFRMYDQNRLLFIVKHLSSLGAKVIVSNSASPITKELYDGFNQYEIKAARSINVKGNKRGKISELLITNF